MTDQELLEFAAKAIGYRVFYTEPSLISGTVYQCFFDGEWQADWNPLKNDGDAFRLALKCLPFHVLQYTSEDYEYCNQDGCAATRRAIVRAAAEIGKAMK